MIVTRTRNNRTRSRRYHFTEIFNYKSFAIFPPRWISIVNTFRWLHEQHYSFRRVTAKFIPVCTLYIYGPPRENTWNFEYTFRCNRSKFIMFKFMPCHCKFRTTVSKSTTVQISGIFSRTKFISSILVVRLVSDTDYASYGYK